MRPFSGHWPGRAYEWIDGKTIYVSVPFTWELPRVRAMLQQRSLLWDHAVVGGPAVKLMPDYLDNMPDVTIGDDMPGVLQRINPIATRTTLGCPNRCGFCAVNRIEGAYTELDDWPDGSVLCDSNLLAASEKHLQRVLNRLQENGMADFNQGLDASLLSDWHAREIAKIKRVRIYLAADSDDEIAPVLQAVERLHDNGVSSSSIRCYCLIGYDDTPAGAWRRLQRIDATIMAIPLWFHPLNCLVRNPLTTRQKALGWTHDERMLIQGYFFKHRIRDERLFWERTTIAQAEVTG